MPHQCRQFDYDTITDVILRSRDEGLFAVFDLKNDFPNEWNSANRPQRKIVAKDVYLYVSRQ